MAVYCSECGIENQPQWQFCVRCGTRLLLQIGTLNSTCPYCTTALNKKPDKKTKCLACGNYIFVRTRPTDRERVLVTESQAEQIKAQWALVNGVYDQHLAEKQTYDEHREELKNHFGIMPSDNDVKWSILNRQSIENAQSGKWGLYRNTKFEMAEILRKEKRHEHALSAFLEVCYLDINGPQNSAATLIGRPAFLPSDRFLAPGVIDRVVRLIGNLDLDVEQTWLLFQEISNINHQALRLPVSPQEAWGLLKPQIFD